MFPRPARRRPPQEEENVASITHSKFVVEFDLVLQFLINLKDACGAPLYQVDMRILNTMVHGGLPQSRRRVYIVGLLTSKVGDNFKFQWPGAIPMKTLPSILCPASGDPGTLPSCSTGKRNFKQAVSKLSNTHDLYTTDPGQMKIGDLLCGPRRNPDISIGYSPCITRHRGAHSGFWIFSKHRMMTIKEMERLQGVPTQRIDIKRMASPRQYGQMLGNSFSVSVVGRVIRSSLISLGIFNRQELPDPWAT